MGNSAAPEKKPNKLPIIAPARETYTVILRNSGAFLAAIALPFAIYLANAHFYGFYYSAAVGLFDIDRGAGRFAAELFLHVAPWFVLLLAVTLLGLAWHSFFVLGKSWPRWRSRRMSLGRWGRYFLWSALFFALTSILLGKAKGAVLQEMVLLFGAPPGVRDLLLYQAQFFVSNAMELVVAVFWIRFALVLPMAGLSGQRYGLRDSWRDTRGQGVRFLLIVGLVYLPYAGVIELLHWSYFHVFDTGRFANTAALIPDYGGFPVSRVAYEILGALRSTLFMGILISLLSVLFLALKGRELALAELAEDQSRPPLRAKLRAAILRARYWRQPD